MIEGALQKVASYPITDFNKSLIKVWYFDSSKGGFVLDQEVYSHQIASSSLTLSHFETSESEIELNDSELMERLIYLYRHYPTIVTRQYSFIKHEDGSFFNPEYSNHAYIVDGLIKERTYNEDTAQFDYAMVIKLTDGITLLDKRLLRNNVWHSGITVNDDLPKDWRHMVMTNTSFTNILQEAITNAIVSPIRVKGKSNVAMASNGCFDESYVHFPVINPIHDPVPNTYIRKECGEDSILAAIDDRKKDMNCWLTLHEAGLDYPILRYVMTQVAENVTLPSDFTENHIDNISYGYDQSELIQGAFCKDGSKGYYDTHPQYVATWKILPYEVGVSTTTEDDDTTSATDLVQTANEARQPDGATSEYMEAQFRNSTLVPYSNYKVGDFLSIRPDNGFYDHLVQFRVTSITETIEEDSISYDISVEQIN